MKRNAIALAAILAASAWFQAWFLGLTPHGVRLGDPSLSSAYTEALARGQSYLLATPDPRLLAAKDPFGATTQRLLIWDTSYFRGHFYMYFGIVPFAVFLVPWLFLTGAAPSPELTILIFSVVGYAAYGLILLAVARRDYPRVPVWLLGTAFLAVILSSGTWPLMGRPAIYEIENAAAYAFLALSLLSLATYEISQEQPLGILCVAAGLAALTMGCRPNYFPAVTVVVSWTLYRSWCRAGKRGTSPALAVLVQVLPVAVVGAALGFWNYHRFGSPLDFGLKHTVSDDPALAKPLSTLANLPYHVHRYTVGLARLDRFFPFIQGQREGPFHVGALQEVSNQVYGFLVVTPITLASLAAFVRPRAADGLRNFYVVCFAAFLGNFLFLSSLFMSCYRYPADFLGPLAIVSALGVLHVSSLSPRSRSCGLGAAVLLTAWSAFAVTCETFSTAQTTELFDVKRPRDFDSARRFFNEPLYLYDSITGNGARSIRFTLQLPLNRTGGNEPLMTVGDAGAQDFVYLHFAGPDSIQIGYESMGLGGCLSPYATIDYRIPHTIEIQMGSFLPPDGHPFFDGMSPKDIAALRKSFLVRLDSKALMAQQVSFHLPRDQVFIGESPFDSAFGDRFTGTMIHVEHPKVRSASELSP